MVFVTGIAGIIALAATAGGLGEVVRRSVVGRRFEHELAAPARAGVRDLGLWSDDSARVTMTW